jgi:hypothetical protein
MAKKFDEQYSDEEAQRRFEAALRGARLATPQPVKDKPITRQAEAQRRRREKERHSSEASRDI